jgi:hypothetical protein
VSLSSRYYKLLGLAVAAILIAGVARLFTNAAAAELQAHRTASPPQLESLALYLKPIAPSPPAPLVEPFVAPRYDADEPTRPPSGTVPPAKPGWTVSAILISDVRRVAVVNEELVTIGSRTTSGARIVAIEPDHVVLTEPGGARRVVRVAADR